MLELRHLRYFVAVAEELNFSRAAERLHMAQPPLSAAIRQLEQELGADLLLRTTREVRLTEAGRTFLDGARRTLAELDRAQIDAQRAAAGEMGQLRIGFSWSARFQTLPAIGRSFRRSHPDVSLLTEEMWNARMLPALRSGAIDVAVSLCPEIAGEFSYLPIRSEPVIALVAKTHPLAASHQIELRALADESFLLFPRELAPRLYDLMTGLCRRAGFEPLVRDESFHSGWELQILSDVDIVALAPASVALELPDGIAAAAVSDPPDRLETAIVWRKGDPSPTNRAFRDAARAVFADGALARAESLLLDLQIDLLAKDRDVARCLDPDSHLLAHDRQYGDLDVVADHDALVGLAGQNQHDHAFPPRRARTTSCQPLQHVGRCDANGPATRRGRGAARAAGRRAGVSLGSARPWPDGRCAPISTASAPGCGRDARTPGSPTSSR
jgi:DNA-binding transcriptional LysR family regulator